MRASRLYSNEYTNYNDLLRGSNKDLNLGTRLVLLRQLHLNPLDVLRVESPAE